MSPIVTCSYLLWNLRAVVCFLSPSKILCIKNTVFTRTLCIDMVVACIGTENSSRILKKLRGLM